MNSSMVHCSGALLLEPMNQFMLSVKMANRDNPIPITSNTPAKKINGMASFVEFLRGGGASDS